MANVSASHAAVEDSVGGTASADGVAESRAKELIKRDHPVYNHDEPNINAATAAPASAKRPRKANYRQRAHCNPLSDAYIAYPASPDYVDWSVHFPTYFESPSTFDSSLFLNTADHPVTYDVKIDDDKNGTRGKCVSFLDIGCGFGGLLFFLSRQYPDKLTLGLEIREKVTCFVGEKIRSFRQEATNGEYSNIAVLRSNAMKFLSNYIRKDQIEKMFFCFPDPHFKRANWRRRIVTPQLLSLYAYHLKSNGLIYVVTDVSDLFQWMERSFEVHPLFERVPSDLAQQDAAFHAISQVTDEGKKMHRNGQTIYSAVYRCTK